MKNYIESLLVERAGYEKRGLNDRVAAVDAALGVVGFADMAVQVRAVDPDVRDLLSPYRILGVA